MEVLSFSLFLSLSHYHQFNRKRVYCGIYQHNSYTVCLVYPLEKQIVNTHTISSALDVSTVNKQRSEVLPTLKRRGTQSQTLNDRDYTDFYQLDCWILDESLNKFYRYLFFSFTEALIGPMTIYFLVMISYLFLYPPWMKFGGI